MRRLVWSLTTLLLFAPAASAEPSHVLRMASIVPDGTAWARELRALVREVEAATHGALKVKLYLGGVAGDEIEVGARIRRGQLDGVVSGGMLCEELAPSLRMLRLPGLVQSHEESTYLIGRLRPQLDREFARAGFANLGDSGIGAAILFTRTPVSSMAELRAQRYWIWNTDQVSELALTAMGIKTLPLPIYQAGKAYDDQRDDGFITPPTAALAFQWSTQARYFTALPLHYVTGCLLVANRAFDGLPLDEQQALRAAAAKTQARFDEISQELDAQLLGGLFARQGLRPVTVSGAFRAELYDAARAARSRVAAKVGAPELLDHVLSLLADYRAEHP
ncbi:MAG TPA: TRAP transporter substrate-binding protein DctP [Polyangia bacterium]